MSKLAKPLPVLLVIVGFFLFWETGCRLFKTPTYFLPLPSMIFVEIAQQPLWYLSHSLATAMTTTVGFGLALVLGAIAAVGITYSRILERILYTLLVSFNSVPKIALAPLFIIWLGTGASSKIAVTFSIAVFAIVIDTVLGLRSVDPDALSLLKTMHASRMQELLKLRLPNALPYMFAGMKVAISLALVGSIAGEFVASQEGLGFLILASQSMMQTTRLFAAIILLGLMGTLLFYLTNLAERLACPWHVSQRDQSGHTQSGHAV